ncbi:MAG TPA: MBL fold metallo-hydrolase [Candidatus Thermoplasmatota archaeon]|nr:MBL fold metallo-hydrolase [Candidatus Thermoplasmatota archaeon]
MTVPRIVKLGGRGWDCNQFLVKHPDSNSYDLIDAGHGLDLDRILTEVAAIVDPKRIGTVAVTHEHLDHVNGIPKWQALGAKVAASRGAADKLAAGRDPTSEQFGGRIPTVTVDRVLDDEEDLGLGGIPFRALAVPGHSPGSMCYWHAPSGTLFSGDTLFAEGGIGRFDFPDGDLRLMDANIKRLGALPVRSLHCGHGPSVEGDAAKRSVAASVRHVQMCVADSANRTN